MELPFDVEDTLETVGNIQVLRRNSSDIRDYEMFLANREVGEKLHLASKNELYKHQILASRYLFHQDSLILLHEPGTGKTETSQFEMLSLLCAGLISRIMIVNGSDTLNIKANKTFKNLWITEGFYNRYSNMTLPDFINRYVVYDTYAKVSRRYSDVPNVFDYTGVIFDEAHNLVSENTGTKRNFDAVRLVEVLSRSKGCKVILSSATPIINDASAFDVIQKILLRTPNVTHNIIGELVSYKQAVYDHLNIVQMWNPNDALKGRVSAECDENGTPVEQSFDLKVYRVRPYRVQLADIVEHLVDTDARDFNVVFDTLAICSAGREIDISLHPLLGDPATVPASLSSITSGIPPIPSTEAMDGDVEEEEDSTEAEQYSSNVTGSCAHSTATSYTGNRQVVDSCFMDEIVKNIRASKDGVVIVYMSLKKEGSEMISKLLKLYGFEQYTGIPQEKPTFLLYGSGAQGKQRKLFEDAKKPENWNGSIVKVIIGSRVMRDSVDIHHVTQIHITQPEWHIPGLIQAWHRGIRSNGHNWLIYHRALQLMKEKPELTLNEARKLIKIDYQVFNYVINITDLTENEINASRSLFRLESNKRLSNDEIRRRVKERDPSLRKIEIALKKYSEVGSIMESLRRNSIDYRLNRGEVSSEVTRCIPKGNFFFTRDMCKKIIQTATTLITEKFQIDIKELIQHITEKYPFMTERFILSSLNHMLRNEYILFVPKFGIQMSVREAGNQLVLTSVILDGTGVTSSNERVTTVMSQDYSVCVLEELSFQASPLELNDLEISPCRRITIVNKLKQALLDALRITSNDDITKVSSNEHVRSSDLTWSFLRHMTNFWGIPISNLSNVTDDTSLDTSEMNIYIFSRHVSKCSIHVKQSVKGVLTVNSENISLQDNMITFSTDKQWIQARSKDIRLVRPLELLELYDKFDLSGVPELLQSDTLHNIGIDMKSYIPKTNGILMLKVFSKVTPLILPDTSTGLRLTYKEYLKLYLESIINFEMITATSLVSIKEFADTRSKGRQLELPKDMRKKSEDTLDISNVIKECIIEKLSKGVYIIFFPYEDPSEDTSITETGLVKGSEADIPVTVSFGLMKRLIELKKRELKDIEDAEQGNPCYKYKLPIIEYMRVTNRITEERRKEIYRSLWKH